MTFSSEDSELFDRWARTYDASVPVSTGFPLAGYEQVLKELLLLGDVEPGMSALDLGTGTGNLAGLLLAGGCTVWATDFSPGMIGRARAKHPEVQFSITNLRDGVPPAFPERYHRIVSAYAFHHLGPDEKVVLIHSLAQDHLLQEGRLLIADVAFRTVRDLEAARSRYADTWDASEHYWAADETAETLRSLHLDVAYVQVSFCGGIFSIRPTHDASDNG